MIKIETNLGLIPKDELVLKEDGNIFEVYLDEKVDGKYQPDLTEQLKYDTAIAESEAKEVRNEELESLVVTTNSVKYDANERSRNNMGNVLSVLNFKALNAMYLISKDIIKDDDKSHPMYAYCVQVVTTYEAIYKEKIGWKNVNNEKSEPQRESIAETLEEAMYQVADILGV